jgi:hypothetical protein
VTKGAESSLILIKIEGEDSRWYLADPNSWRQEDLSHGHITFLRVSLRHCTIYSNTQHIISVQYVKRNGYGALNTYSKVRARSKIYWL